MEILFSKWSLRFCEIWFNDLPPTTNWKYLYKNADILVFRESYDKATPDSKPFKNGVIALDEPIDCLFSKLNSGFRNEVRRATKEGIKYQQITNCSLFDRIYASYVLFSTQKNLIAINHAQLKRYLSGKNLFITAASFNDTLIQCHFYFTTRNEAILLASFPINTKVPSKIFGWANRGLHWNDIKTLKDAGISRYNLGGMGNPITETNKSIVAFKNEMRPVETVYYNETLALTTFGNMYLFLKRK